MRATEEQLQQFHEFALAQLRGGAADLTMDDRYDHWRMEFPSDEEAEDDLRAVQEAIDDMERGDTGKSLEEFARDFQLRHGIVDSH